MFFSIRFVGIICLNVCSFTVRCKLYPILSPIDPFQNQFRIGLRFRLDRSKESIMRQPMYSAKNVYWKYSDFVQTVFPVVCINLNRMWLLKHHFIEDYQLINYRYPAWPYYRGISITVEIRITPNDRARANVLVKLSSPFVYIFER